MLLTQGLRPRSPGSLRSIRPRPGPCCPCAGAYRGYRQPAHSRWHRGAFVHAPHARLHGERHLRADDLGLLSQFADLAAAALVRHSALVAEVDADAVTLQLTQTLQHVVSHSAQLSASLSANLAAAEQERRPLEDLDAKLTYQPINFEVATGCWFGRRTMRLVDMGKVAATFVDSRDGRAFRIRPRTSARELAHAAAPDAQSHWHAYLEAYQVLPDEELLEAWPVRLTLDLKALISRNGVRAECEVCGEEIINEREVVRDGRVYCRSCAEEAYYQRVGAARESA